MRHFPLQTIHDTKQRQQERESEVERVWERERKIRRMRTHVVNALLRYSCVKQWQMPWTKIRSILKYIYGQRIHNYESPKRTGNYFIEIQKHIIRSMIQENERNSTVFNGKKKRMKWKQTYWIGAKKKKLFISDSHVCDIRNFGVIRFENLPKERLREREHFNE